MIFYVDRFHGYLYGRKFTVINDQQPLKSIFCKFTVSSPSGIQKIFPRLQKYKFDLKFSSGKTMLASDALSRAYIKHLKP